MIRNFLKPKLIKNELKRLSVLYSTLLTLTQAFNRAIIFKIFPLGLILSLPKRQQYFTFINFLSSVTQTFSSGILLQELQIRMKFYKRSFQNMAVLLLQLKKKFKGSLNFLFFLYIPNFNFRHYTFFKKLQLLINPQIYYFHWKHSYQPFFFRKRRIKRRILRLLQKV